MSISQWIWSLGVSILQWRLIIEPIRGYGVQYEQWTRKNFLAGSARALTKNYDLWELSKHCSVAQISKSRTLLSTDCTGAPVNRRSLSFLAMHVGGVWSSVVTNLSGMRGFLTIIHNVRLVNGIQFFRGVSNTMRRGAVPVGCVWVFDVRHQCWILFLKFSWMYAAASPMGFEILIPVM